MSINLQKRISLVKETLEKKNLSTKGQVAIAIDISYSMNHLFQRGVVQELVERLLAIGINMDLDEQIDVYLFGSGAHNAAVATANNIDGYVNREILSKFSLEGSTLYEPVSRMISKDAGYLSSAGGFMSKLFGSSSPKKRKEPTYVFFVTDGDNHDQNPMTSLIKQVSNKPIFWQFIGIGGSHFSYLEHLDEMSGRHVDNANFFSAKDIANISDEELYERILGELPDWVNEIKRLNMI